MSEETKVVAIILLTIIIGIIWLGRERQNALEDFASFYEKHLKRDKHNELCELLNPYFDKEVKIRGMLVTTEGIFVGDEASSYSADKGLWYCSIRDATLTMISSKVTTPVWIKDSEIKVQMSERFFRKLRKSEYYEYKGIFSEGVYKNEKAIIFDLISARKLSREEVKKLKMMYRLREEE